MEESEAVREARKERERKERVSELSFRSNPDVLTLPGDKRTHGHQIVAGIAGKLTTEYADQAAQLEGRAEGVENPMDTTTDMLGLGPVSEDHIARVNHVKDTVYDPGSDVRPFRIAADHATTIWPWAEYLKAVGNTVQLYKQKGETPDKEYCRTLSEQATLIAAEEKEGADAMQSVNSIIVGTMSVILGFDRIKGFEEVETIFKRLAELSPQTALDEATVQIALLIAQGRTDLERSERARKKAETERDSLKVERTALLASYAELRKQTLELVNTTVDIRQTVSAFTRKRDYEQLVEADIMTHGLDGKFDWAVSKSGFEPMRIDILWPSEDIGHTLSKDSALLGAELHSSPGTFDDGFAQVIRSHIEPAKQVITQVAWERSIVIHSAAEIAKSNKAALQSAMKSYVTGPDGTLTRNISKTMSLYGDYVEKFPPEKVMDLAMVTEAILPDDTLGIRVGKITTALKSLTEGLIEPVRINVLYKAITQRETQNKAAGQDRQTLENQLGRWGTAFASRFGETSFPMAQLQKTLDTMIGPTAEETKRREATQQPKRRKAAKKKGKEKEGEEEGEIQDRGFNKFGAVVEAVDRMEIADPTMEDLTDRLDLLLRGLQASFRDVNKLLKETNDYYTTTFRIVVEKYARDLGDIGPDLEVLDRGLADDAAKFQDDWNIAKKNPSLRGKMEIVGDAAEIYKRAYESCTAVITKKIAPEMGNIRARIETNLQAAAKGLALTLHDSLSDERKGLLTYARLIGTDRANLNVVRSMTTSTARVRDLVRVSGKDNLVGDVAEKSLQNLVTLIIYLTTMMEDMARVVKRSAQTTVDVKKDVDLDEAGRRVDQVLAYVSSLKAGTEDIIQSVWAGYDAVVLNITTVDGTLQGYEDAAGIAFSMILDQTRRAHGWLDGLRSVAADETMTHPLVKVAVNVVNRALQDLTEMQTRMLDIIRTDSTHTGLSEEMFAYLERLQNNYDEIWKDVEEAQNVVDQFYKVRFGIEEIPKLEPMSGTIDSEGSIPEVSIILPDPGMIAEPQMISIPRSALEKKERSLQEVQETLETCLSERERERHLLLTTDDMHNAVQALRWMFLSHDDIESATGIKFAVDDPTCTKLRIALMIKGGVVAIMGNLAAGNMPISVVFACLSKESHELNGAIGAIAKAAGGTQQQQARMSQLESENAALQSRLEACTEKLEREEPKGKGKLPKEGEEPMEDTDPAQGGEGEDTTQLIQWIGDFYNGIASGINTIYGAVRVPIIPNESAVKLFVNSALGTVSGNVVAYHILLSSNAKQSALLNVLLGTVINAFNGPLKVYTTVEATARTVVERINTLSDSNFGVSTKLANLGDFLGKIQIETALTNSEEQELRPLQQLAIQLNRPGHEDIVAIVEQEFPEGIRVIGGAEFKIHKLEFEPDDLKEILPRFVRLDSAETENVIRAAYGLNIAMGRMKHAGVEPILSDEWTINPCVLEAEILTQEQRDAYSKQVLAGHVAEGLAECLLNLAVNMDFLVQGALAPEEDVTSRYPGMDRPGQSSMVSEDLVERQPTPLLSDRVDSVSKDPRPPTKTVPTMSTTPSETDAFGFL